MSRSNDVDHLTRMLIGGTIDDKVLGADPGLQPLMNLALMTDAGYVHLMKDVDLQVIDVAGRLVKESPDLLVKSMECLLVRDGDDLPVNHLTKEKGISHLLKEYLSKLNLSLYLHLPFDKFDKLKKSEKHLAALVPLRQDHRHHPKD